MIGAPAPTVEFYMSRKPKKVRKKRPGGPWVPGHRPPAASKRPAFAPWVGSRCRHCGRKIGRRAPRRGLCYRCHRNREIRLGYSPVSKFGKRGVGTLNESRPAEEPTETLPGTEERILALQARAEAQQELKHPLDAQRPTF